MAKSLELLQQSIESAKLSEQQQGQLHAYLQSHQQRLHSAITVTADSPNTALMAFAVEYVDAVPQHLQALSSLSKEIGIDPYTEAFLKLVSTYFLSPPDILSPYQGLHGALCKAYVAHRLMEEINDQVMNLGGAALAPMDMSMANIIAHELIGDEFANQLDHLVLLTVETTDTDKSIFQQEKVKELMQQRRFAGWEDVLKQWPCFTEDCGVDLQIGG